MSRWLMRRQVTRLSLYLIMWPLVHTFLIVAFPELCALQLTCKLFKTIHCAWYPFLFQSNGLTPLGWEHQ